jgi:hypothetical protein
MTTTLLALAQRIREELDNIDRLLERSQEAWQRFENTGDDDDLDSVALSLHGCYAALERLLELIAGTVDGNIPTGANWHHALLQQMTKSITGTRPPVLSEAMADDLDEYRGFRHVVRHAYALRFEAGKLQSLVERAPAVFANARAALTAFAVFLEQRAQTSGQE